MKEEEGNIGKLDWHTKGLTWDSDLQFDQCRRHHHLHLQLNSNLFSHPQVATHSPNTLWLTRSTWLDLLNLIAHLNFDSTVTKCPPLNASNTYKLSLGLSRASHPTNTCERPTTISSHRGQLSSIEVNRRRRSSSSFGACIYLSRVNLVNLVFVVVIGVVTVNVTSLLPQLSLPLSLCVCMFFSPSFERPKQLDQAANRN